MLPGPIAGAMVWGRGPIAGAISTGVSGYWSRKPSGGWAFKPPCTDNIAPSSHGALSEDGHPYVSSGPWIRTMWTLALELRASPETLEVHWDLRSARNPQADRCDGAEWGG